MTSFAGVVEIKFENPERPVNVRERIYFPEQQEVR